MKISYLLILSLLCASLTITKALAECEKGAKMDKNADHVCIVKKVENPCPKGSYFRNDSSDCAKCEANYRYDNVTKSCK